MKTIEEQIAGLVVAAQALALAGVAVTFHHSDGDMPVLVVADTDVEISFVIDGYDLWRNGRPAQQELDLERVVELARAAL